MKNKSILVAGAALIGLLAPAFADPVVLPAAVWSGEVWVDTPPGNPSPPGTTVHDFDSILSSPGTTYFTAPVGVVGDTITAGTETGITPSPFLRSRIVAFSPPINGGLPTGNALATLDYSFVITGPTSLVGVHINAMGYTSTHGLGSSPSMVPLTMSASFSVDGVVSSGINRSSYFRTKTAAELSGEFTVDQTFSLETNRVYNVHLQTSLFASISGYQGGGSINAEAFVDPTFTIDPTNAGDASLYQISFSAGMQNPGAAVPDGVSVGLLVLGAFSIIVGSAKCGPGGFARD